MQKDLFRKEKKKVFEDNINYHYYIRTFQMKDININLKAKWNILFSDV